MTLPPVAGECVSLSDDIARLPRIFDEACQVFVWQRPEPPGVAAYLQAALDAGRLGGGFRQTIAVGEPLAFDHLPDLPGRAAFIEDLRLITDLYGELLGCPQIGLRLETLTRAMCPRFHVDRTGIRLLCTYRGPGTEWLADHAADRDRLGQRSAGAPDSGSGLILDPAGIGVAPTFSLVLLKGSLWQGNAGRGAIHRSPAVPDQDTPRLVLALDAVW